MTKPKIKDISRGIRLTEDNWKALAAMRKAQGVNGKLASYNKVMGAWLGVNGKLSVDFPPMAEGQCHWEVNGKIVGPTRGCKHGKSKRKISR